MTESQIFHVLLFAGLREHAGTNVLEVELPLGAKAYDLRKVLAEKLPEIAGLIERSAIAVNETYVSGEAPIPLGAEIACIPPVSGG